MPLDHKWSFVCFGGSTASNLKLLACFVVILHLVYLYILRCFAIAPLSYPLLERTLYDDGLIFGVHFVALFNYDTIIKRTRSEDL